MYFFEEKHSLIQLIIFEGAMRIKNQKIKRRITENFDLLSQKIKVVRLDDF